MITTNNTQNRGRPKRFNTHQLLQTVQTLFHQHGYNGVGVAEICKQCHVTPTSLYNEFGNKEALFLKAVSTYRHELSAAFSDAVAQITSSNAIFRGILEFATGYFTRTGQIKGCLLFDLSDISNNVSIRDGVNEAIQEFELTLSKNIADAGVEHAQDLTKILITLFRGLASEAKMGATYNDLVIKVEFFCHAFE